MLRYEECAKDAVPVLLELLRNTPDINNLTNRIARQQLVDALQEIGPEASRGGRFYMR